MFTAGLPHPLDPLPASRDITSTRVTSRWKSAADANYSCSAPGPVGPLSRRQVIQAIVDDAAGRGKGSIRSVYGTLDFPSTRSIGAVPAAALT